MVDMRMQIQEDVPSGTYDEVDLAALCLAFTNLSFGYSHPHVLNFTVKAPCHTTPLARNSHIIVWDDDGLLPDGVTDQDVSHPIFEGFLEDVRPGDDGNTVLYTAYDPTHIGAKMCPVMSAAWQEGNFAGPTRPVKAIGAVPRLVLNCANDADDDYAFARNGLGEAGELIAGILEDQYQPLYWIHAAPGDGSNAGNGLAYVWTDELELLTTIPQEKIVHESTTIRAAITQILTRFHPEWRMFWQPGGDNTTDGRKFRFANMSGAPQVDLKFNDPTSPYKILGVSIQPTTEGRYGAVEIRGPETTVTNLFTWINGEDDNTVEPIGDGVVLEVYSDVNGTHNAIAYTSFQIVDADLRRGSKLLPQPYQLICGSDIVAYRGPVIQLSFDEGVTWTSCNAWFDHYNGIAYWDSPIYIHQSASPPGSNQNFFPPNAVRLLWASYVDPLIVRSPGPESGFGGSAGSFIGSNYTEANLPAEFDLYDESLAIGYEYGTPVTTAYRRAQFQALADSILFERKDIAWAGNIVLDGLQWDFAWLAKRINLTADDANGDPITTGWEDINAWLTDVEFDLDKGITTLTILSDQLANLGYDVQGHKERLKIKALEQVRRTSYSTIIERMADGLPFITAVKETASFDYVDPDSGNVVDTTG